MLRPLRKVLPPFWRIPPKACITSALTFLSPGRTQGEALTPIRNQVLMQVEHEYPDLFNLYTNFHSNPELSFNEEKTSASLAEALRKAGYEVTSGIGKHGVVAIF